MPSFETEVKTYQVDYRCDECGKGVMRHTDNVALTTWPVQYRHCCTECGHSQRFPRVYPFVVHRPAAD